MPDASVLYDAFYTPSGINVDTLLDNADYFQFINEGFKHCKTLSFAEGTEKLMQTSLIKKDCGVVFEKDNKNWTHLFIDIIKQYLEWNNEMDRKAQD